MKDIRNHWWGIWCLLTIATPAAIVVLRAMQGTEGIITFALIVMSFFIVPVVCLLGAVFRSCPAGSQALESPVDKKVIRLVGWFFACWIIAGIIPGDDTLEPDGTSESVFEKALAALGQSSTVDAAWALMPVMTLSSVIPYFWLYFHLANLPEPDEQPAEEH